MWSNAKGLFDVVQRLERFRPPYCPNAKCDWHKPQAAKEAKFHRHGEREISYYPYFSPRFQCSRCRKTCTASFFTLSHRDRTQPTYEEIFDLRLMGASKLQIARFLKTSPDTVRRRIQKMARWGLVELAKDLEKVKILEPIAYDGLENFSYSQYEPNNLNHAIGKKTFFIYDFNLSPMNRKGKMSPWQKRRKAELEKVHGLFKPSIEENSRKIFERLLAKCEGRLELHTDNHYAYQNALRKIRSRGKILHLITPGKVARTYRNRLFAINHSDMLSRHQKADFKRETIAFAKDTVSMMESFILLATFKNYVSPIFISKDKKSYRHETPAMALGVRKKFLSFREFFKTRPLKTHVCLNEEWLALYERRDSSSRHVIRPYNGP